MGKIFDTVLGRSHAAAGDRAADVLGMVGGPLALVGAGVVCPHCPLVFKFGLSCACAPRLVRRLLPEPKSSSATSV